MDLGEEGLESLRNARFPVYAVPPSEWQGDVMMGGGWGETRHPLSIDLRYEDDLLVEWPERRISISSTGIEGIGHRSPSDGFLLWEHSYTSTVVNFVNNISRDRLPERPVHGTERFNATMIDGKLVPRVVHLPTPGPRRLMDVVEFRDGFQMERVAFDEAPELRLYRVQMPEVEVVILAWCWEDEPLLEFSRKAQPIQRTEGLYEEVSQAQHAAWEKIERRKDSRGRSRTHRLLRVGVRMRKERDGG